MTRQLLLALVPATLLGQNAPRSFDVLLGRWNSGSPGSSYDLRFSAPLGGPLSHGLALAALVNDNLGRRRAFYGAGYELQALRRRAALGPYLVAGALLGLSTDTTTQELAVLWSAGGGVEWRPVSWFAVDAEARYRVEDRGPQGFWNTRPDARSGWDGALGVSLGLGRRGRSAATPPSELSGAPTVATGNAADVVSTALGALGTPYQWGGTAENAFDCSGLVQYAYGQHGIRLPRRSRDQAEVGAEVTPVVEALRPGDILLFSVHEGAGVTHVGLYVGEGQFIHSASDGVKLSHLDPHDPDGAYWIARWVGARRVIP